MNTCPTIIDANSIEGINVIFLKENIEGIVELVNS